MTIFPLTKPPLTLPGIRLWLDANDPAGNGTQPANSSALATWVDKSGRINNAANATGSQQPLFKTNIQGGLPVVRFDGIDDWFSTPSVINTSDFTLFEVKKVLNYVDKRGVYYYNGSAQGFYSNNQNNGQGVYFFTPTTVLENTVQSANFFVQTHRKSNTTGNIFKNGSLDSGASVNAAAQNAYLTIGADYVGGSCGNTDYCEIIFYSYALSNAEVTSITNYLKNKWSIA